MSSGAGVVSLQGFLIAFVGEIFNVGALLYTLGIVVNLYRNGTMNIVSSALLLKTVNRIGEGSKVSGLSRLASIMLGDYIIGSILDPIGHVILNYTRINASYPWVIESPGPGIIDRQSLFEPLQTGVISIDSMIPIGRGQRELIVGDRQVGKTSIGVDSILNQKQEMVFCVYQPIGAKASSILEVYLALVRKASLVYSSFLVASSASSACLQYLSAYTGSSLAEFFCLIGQLPSFIVYDDLSKHTVAYREIYLLLRRPPGREAYPGEIFFVHARLLERGVKLSYNLGGGSITAFPVIETLAADVSAYITTNVISITDGQIFLSSDLFLSGIQPAIDIGLSVTRVGSIAQWNNMKLVVGSYKLDLAQFIELQSFSQFVADLGSETKKRLTRGRRLLKMLTQYCGSPMKLRKQIGILSLANQDITKDLEINSVYLFVRLYLSVPIWAQLFVSPRIVGFSIASVLNN